MRVAKNVGKKREWVQIDISKQRGYSTGEYEMVEEYIYKRIFLDKNPFICYAMSCQKLPKVFIIDSESKYISTFCSAKHMRENTNSRIDLIRDIRTQAVKIDTMELKEKAPIMSTKVKQFLEFLDRLEKENLIH